jgi:chemotaxis protein MotB
MTNQIAGSNKDTPESDPTAQKDTGYLQALARDFYRLLNVPDEEDKPVSVEVTSDGLKITLYNRARRPLFVGQTAEFTEWGRFVVQTLAWLIERHDFRVYIDGHSERAKFEKPEYGPWELSADRANAARRSLEYYAVDGRKFERVTGFGDTVPVRGMPPEAEANARITVSLSMVQKPLPKAAPKKDGADEKVATAKEDAPAKDGRDHLQNVATKSH